MELSASARWLQTWNFTIICRSNQLRGICSREMTTLISLGWCAKRNPTGQILREREWKAAWTILTGFESVFNVGTSATEFNCLAGRLGPLNGELPETELHCCIYMILPLSRAFRFAVDFCCGAVPIRNT